MKRSLRYLNIALLFSLFVETLQIELLIEGFDLKHILRIILAIVGLSQP